MHNINIHISFLVRKRKKLSICEHYHVIYLAGHIATSTILLIHIYSRQSLLPNRQLIHTTIGPQNLWTNTPPLSSIYKEMRGNLSAMIPNIKIWQPWTINHIMTISTRIIIFSWHIALSNNALHSTSFLKASVMHNER